MKTLDKLLGHGCSKYAYTIKDYPKQVALVFHWRDQSRDFAELKKEHQALSRLRKLGIPALPARLGRVFNPLNPNGPKEQWAMIVPRMQENIKFVGTSRFKTVDQWKAYLNVYRALAKADVTVYDLQMLFDNRRVMVSDPLDVWVGKAAPDYLYRARRYEETIENIEAIIANFFPNTVTP